MVFCPFIKRNTPTEYIFTAAIRMLRQKGYIQSEDKIAYLSVSFGKNGGTSLLEINRWSQVFDKSYEFHLPRYGDVNSTK